MYMRVRGRFCLCLGVGSKYFDSSRCLAAVPGLREIPSNVRERTGSKDTPRSAHFQNCSAIFDTKRRPRVVFRTIFTQAPIMNEPINRRYR